MTAPETRSEVSDPTTPTQRVVSFFPSLILQNTQHSWRCIFFPCHQSGVSVFASFFFFLHNFRDLTAAQQMALYILWICKTWTGLCLFFLFFSYDSLYIHISMVFWAFFFSSYLCPLMKYSLGIVSTFKSRASAFLLCVYMYGYICICMFC